MCEYCKTPGKTLDVIETKDRIFVGVAGAYIQIFNEEYPGFIHNIPIWFCPICGRELKRGSGFRKKGGSDNGKQFS